MLCPTYEEKDSLHGSAGYACFSNWGRTMPTRPFIHSVRCSDTSAGATLNPPGYGASKRRCDAAVRPLNLLRSSSSSSSSATDRAPAGGGAALALV